MKVSETERFKLSKQPSGIHSLGNMILFWTSGSGELCCVRKKNSAEERINELPMKPLGMSVYEGHLFFIGHEERSLFRMKLNTQSPEKILELKQLEEQLARINPAILAPNSKITDIHVFGSKVLIAVDAGYSSGVYKIDIEERRAVTFFHSLGAAPKGITSDPQTGEIFVAGHTGYMFQFDPRGIKTEKPAAKLPIDSPFGLSVGMDRVFYVGVENASEVIGFSIEEEK